TASTAEGGCGAQREFSTLGGRFRQISQLSQLSTAPPNKIKRASDSFRSWLAREPGRGSSENSCSPHQQAEVPEHATPGKQGDGGNHQRDFKEDFAQVEPVGLLA